MVGHGKVFYLRGIVWSVSGIWFRDSLGTDSQFIRASHVLKATPMSQNVPSLKAKCVITSMSAAAASDVSSNAADSETLLALQSPLPPRVTLAQRTVDCKGICFQELKFNIFRGFSFSCNDHASNTCTTS